MADSSWLTLSCGWQGPARALTDDREAVAAVWMCTVI
ncbi:MAG: hypothetical protein RLZZ611_1077 [Cyanobacteriota bacterium]|jgi:hypothetical protein